MRVTHSSNSHFWDSRVIIPYNPLEFHNVIRDSEEVANKPSYMIY